MNVFSLIVLGENIFRVASYFVTDNYGKEQRLMNSAGGHFYAITMKAGISSVFTDTLKFQL